MKIKQVVLKAFRWEMEGLLWVCLASWEGLQHIARALPVCRARCLRGAACRTCRSGGKAAVPPRTGPES